MAEPILTYELKALLNKISSDLVEAYPIQTITLNYLLLAILENKSCEGYQVISRVMMSSSVEDFKTFLLEKIQEDCLNSPKMTNKPVFSPDYDNLTIAIANSGVTVVSSADMFVSIATDYGYIMRYLGDNGVSISQIKDAYDEHEKLLKEVSVSSVSKKTKKKKTHTETNNTEDITHRIIPEEKNIVEVNCTNMTRLASKGTYDNIIGFDDKVSDIFDVLGKYDRNTVAVVGGRGVGKTAVVQQLANHLYKQDCPLAFKDKYLIKFEDQISSLIISEMNKQGKYIALIDDVERLFANKDAEQNNLFVLLELFKSPNICTIIISEEGAYSKIIESKPEFSRYIHKIVIEEPSEEELMKIIKSTCKRYENYNYVSFSDECIKESIRIAKRFRPNEKCPQSALDILDTTASYVRMHCIDSKKLSTLKKKLNEIQTEIDSIKNSGSSEDFDRKDKLIREQIRLTKILASIYKEGPNVIEVTVDNIRKVVSNMINVPICDIGGDELSRLKSLRDNLTSVVIGQDDTVENICRAVKRQRVGLGNPNKPVVMMFVGSTGTGKTFLAKRLAYEMFGDEKNMVRLDMSEYSEKTSVTKLYGASAGYIGYEEGGILTEAIKKNNRCVLLLDEIEKAHDDVFNVLLQVFDDGRMTDNKGTLVDFKNVIIIMTSNVGAKDVADKAPHIGFGKFDEQSEDKDIILKSIKRQFKPEFINRIDNICYFNKLTDDNLKTIIINEIEKVHKKVIEIGYDMDDSLLHGKLVESIFEKVKEEAEYGARPILREIQKQLEDKLTDYIIDNGVDKGHVFTYGDIY